MDLTKLAPIPLEKEAGLLGDAGRALWRYARRPLLGTERAAVGAERRLGQMSATTEKSVADNVTRSGMSRDTHNDLLTKWMEGATYNPAALLGAGGAAYGGYEGYNTGGGLGSILTGAAVGGVLGAGAGKGLSAGLKGLSGKTHQELYSAYQKAAPKSVTSKIAPNPELMSKQKQFETGTGAFAGRGTLAERIEAQKAKDLQASFSRFGDDAGELAGIQKEINSITGAGANPLLGTMLGSGVGGAVGYYREGDLKGALSGAALGGAVGLAGTKGLSVLTREAGEAAKLERLLAQRSDIVSRHGGSLIGQKLNYAARRAIDPILERGRYATLGERLRFGRLGGGYIAGRGLETVGARYRQGGLLGKGGLIRGGLAYDPRIRMNYDMARYAAGQGNYGAALGYGANAALGAGVQAGKFTLMGAMPAYGLYEAAAADDPTQSAARRVAGAVGRGVVGTALFPLGAATWAGSFVPGYEDWSVGEQAGKGLEKLYDYTTNTSPLVPDVERYGRARRQNPNIMVPPNYSSSPSLVQTQQPLQVGSGYEYNQYKDNPGTRRPR